MENRKALGKGLEELFSNSNFTFDNFEDKIQEEAAGNTIEVSLDEIRSNPYQPRKVFDEASLNELADSIKQYGVVEPVILKKSVKGYEIVAGERRCKASKIAGLKTVPAIVKEFSDEQMMEIALLENIQREDLNPIDTAESIEKILNIQNLTQEEFSKRFGKSRSYITNLLGLLRLPEPVKKLVKDSKISMSHARCLSKLEDNDKIVELADKIVKNNLSVRDIENMLSKKEVSEKKGKIKNPELKIYEDALSDATGSKVNISNKKIEISYDSINDLNRILEIFNISFKD